MSTDTRPNWHDELEPMQAASAVAEYIHPQTHGPWKVAGFSVEDDFANAAAMMRAAIGDSPDRYTPPGDYIKLTYEAEGYDIGEENIEKGFVMMSNTPNEIEDHSDAFDHATGNVLVHGLGLGCVVAGLLTKPEVSHIDVVDNDEDVIAITGPAFADDPRVSVHHGNALTFEWPEGKWWDYVWHDIWATISRKNLIAEEAQHGISYFKLFERFRDRCARQEAWVFRYALAMDRATEMAHERMISFAERWRDGSFEERMDLIYEFHTIRRGPDGGPSKEQYRELFQQSGHLKDLEGRARTSDFFLFWFEPHTFYDQAKLLVTEEEVRQYIDGSREFVPHDEAEVVEHMNEMKREAGIEV